MLVIFRCGSALVGGIDMDSVMGINQDSQVGLTNLRSGKYMVSLLCSQLSNC